MASAYAFTLCTGILATGDYAEIVRKSCDAGAVAVQPSQILQVNHTTLVRAPYRGRAEMVR